MRLAKAAVFTAVTLIGFMGYLASSNAFLAGAVGVCSLVPMSVLFLHAEASTQSREAIRRKYVQEVQACTSHAETHRVLRSVALYIKSW